ncbi:MAG: hypothetical protein ACO1OB_12515 [Archangium sp.]
MRTHAWFGQLEAAADGSFDFEKVVTIKGDDVLVSLHFDGVAGVSNETLDAVALLAGQLDALADAARAQMTIDLLDSGSATSMYFDFLKDEAPEILGKTKREGFVKTLRPEKLWSWFEANITPHAFSLQLDFNAAPGEIDHVLCARFDAHGKIESVEIES